MAIGVIFSAAGVTQAQYDQVLKEVMPGNKLAPGMLYHVGGPAQNGWRVFEVWESRDAMDRFFHDKLGAALQKANVNAQPEFFEVHNLVQS